MSDLTFQVVALILIICIAHGSKISHFDSQQLPMEVRSAHSHLSSILLCIVLLYWECYISPSLKQNPIRLFCFQIIVLSLFAHILRS